MLTDRADVGLVLPRDPPVGQLVPIDDVALAMVEHEIPFAGGDNEEEVGALPFVIAADNNNAVGASQPQRGQPAWAEHASLFLFYLDTREKICY